LQFIIIITQPETRYSFYRVMCGRQIQTMHCSVWVRSPYPRKLYITRALMPRSRLLGSRYFWVHFSEFRVHSVPV